MELLEGRNEMTNKEQLKTCPFCGGKAETEAVWDNETEKEWYYVHCKSCYAATDWYDTEQYAIDLWNKRWSE